MIGPFLTDFERFLQLFKTNDTSTVLLGLLLLLLVSDKYFILRNLRNDIKSLRKIIIKSLDQKDKIIETVILNKLGKDEFKKYLFEKDKK